jgi:hypothetical protein
MTGMRLCGLPARALSGVEMPGISLLGMIAIDRIDPRLLGGGSGGVPSTFARARAAQFPAKSQVIAHISLRFLALISQDAAGFGRSPTDEYANA